jgi:hypothetical protein
MDIETAKTVVAAGDTKYSRAFQLLCDWQYSTLEGLRNDGAISEEGFDRMVAVPRGRIVADGGKGGPWIGIRTLTDGEVVNGEAVAVLVVREALNGAAKLKMGDLFSPFLAPSVSRALTNFRAERRQDLGWLGRSLCSTPPRPLYSSSHVRAPRRVDRGNGIASR